MTTGITNFDQSAFNSRLSLRPLLNALKKAIAEGKPGSESLYGDLVARIEATPELLEPISDLNVLKPHKQLVEMLLTTLFPPTNYDNENLYAVSLPFTFKIIYASALFQMLFVKPGTNEVNVPGDEIGRSLHEEKMLFAYTMILKKYYGYTGREISSSVYPFRDQSSGLVKYLELQIDARFIDLNPAGDMPVIPHNAVCPRTNRMMSLEELQIHLPLDKFVFEGIAVIRINDVTEQETISRMKNSLLNTNAFSDASVYKELQAHIQNLIGLQDIRIGITSFFKINGHYVYSELHNSHSLLFKHIKEYEGKDEMGECCKDIFANTNNPVVFEKLDAQILEEMPELKHYYDDGGRSLVISPLKHNGELIGMLEIISNEPGVLKTSFINKIEKAIPLFTLALEKSAETLNNQIDRVIKDKFTAVQPAVEWKFTEAAFNYIKDKQENENVKMERIVFDEVYPLYGAIDIRNSSVERAHSIQLDIIKQLEMTKKIIKKAQAEIFFPLLHETEFKIDKYISSASDILLSENELQIHEFLQKQIADVFDHLRTAVPSLKKDIEDYFSSLDPQANMIYHHRKEYEESISKVNDIVARFIDKEQLDAQKVFPHYFERYVTDGVEFNVYIGQSIVPRRKFDTLYLRNMKMWQLSVLAKAARITNKLAVELPHPLSTTQLILAHSLPISISFRNAERKFDVDGAYNIRYEIIKKRIDKVRIKNSMERLTQPGKIAIVYSQPKEAIEYKEYIEFMQNQNLLKPGIEEFELEELQGVVGLKALRVEVDFEENKQSLNEKVELSSVTSGQLIGK